ncbi:related to D-arabinitol 2-dehydrogenase [ribulose-forming] [Saccharomycodes ludwigii]|uniref:Related to D-arabinitol 2-dehydrogenase [ribulose-forming] n=1 Tax=Saccharomycodes ludwigii TaxID=36035 RepID=A0A376B4H8_9ASCO|nr:hypothetical protein SCDLUD_003400 [Saccharomycodes ludwigii]KAH3900420.1 hypothetical protein SCDLUD_003400 [Saccharomycodes ludwigii]SSD59479.1 related to D-arabinitol 2-dehydrogenase [ribulose-forming] [Saccharomycodes ludwigii]
MTINSNSSSKDSFTTKTNAPQPIVQSATPTEQILPNVDNIVPNFRLDDYVTVVTGGSGGLAHTLCQALLLQGSSLALVDLDLLKLKDVRDKLNSFIKQNNITPKNSNPVKISIWECDVSNSNEVNEIVSKITSEHDGTIPFKLVHTAGFCNNIPAEQYDPVKAEYLVKVNLMGSLYFAQALTNLHLTSQNIPKNRRRLSISTKVDETKNNIDDKVVVDALALPNFKGKVSFVFIGSMSGLIVNTPQPQVAYNMSKAGVIHMVKSLACEWAKYGIRINCISPGYIATDLTKKVISQSAEGAALQKEWTSRIPLGRMAEPKEFVGAMLYLLSDNASTYTTGENMIIDGGYTCW